MNKMTKAEIRSRLGNVAQLQELLFGEQMDEYNHRFTLYQQRLELLENSEREFRLSIEQLLTQLEKKLSNQMADAVNAIEKKLGYLRQTSQTERQQLREDLTLAVKDSQENLELVHDKLKNSANGLRSELTEIRNGFEQENKVFQQQLTTKLESSIEELSSNQLSRVELAEILFELCLKLKQDGSDLTNEQTEQ